MSKRLIYQDTLVIFQKTSMAERDEEEPPAKVPRVLKEKEDGKRLIVILERASLETVKVVFLRKNSLLIR